MGYVRSPSPFHRRTSKRYACAYISAAVLTFFILFVIVPLPSQVDDPRNTLVQHVSDVTTSFRLPDALKPTTYTPPSLETTQSKYAYATFLANDSGDKDDENINHDKYFVATRILAYQLLHAPETRTNNSYPFVVLVNKDVSEAKRERLRQDGCIVWQPEPVDPKWITTWTPTWQSVLTKLRLWELTQFERIVFLDGDTILTRPLDDIFADPAVSSNYNRNDAANFRDDEWPQPRHYVMAGVPEMMAEHHYPPTEEGHDFPNIDYMNAGFFVMGPDRDMLNYYIGLTDTPNRFEPDMPEQNLLNYAHRRQGGNMPWKQLSTEWNIHYPTITDLKGGVASLHEKWWDPVSADLRPYLESWRWRMEGFFEARDGYLVKMQQVEETAARVFEQLDFWIVHGIMGLRFAV